MKIEFAAVGQTHFARIESQTILVLDGQHGTFHWLDGPENQWKEYSQAEGGSRAEARGRWYYRLATALDAVHTLTGGECQCPALETSWTLYGPRRDKISGGDALPIHVSEHSGWTTLEVQTARWQ